MTYQFGVIENSSMPARFKESLVNILRFIQSNEPVGLKQVLLFGSLARSSITCRSDIDICLVFEDGTDIDSYNMRVFRGYLRGLETLWILMLYSYMSLNLLQSHIGFIERSIETRRYLYHKALSSRQQIC